MHQSFVFEVWKGGSCLTTECEIKTTAMSDLHSKVKYNYAQMK